ncbi:hypothetical protein PGT21_028913 [Puccinia graminis f. sp. tritici]|uniref:Uncharacterized protein n=1 Tax=Puccinia graminis f. sp. tritici TaxID=56615 RepID=A0A5B0PG62_PUCGR|nr:hypothetical protein PGT21_028913 [Puccinia graminis f. sp. tritici]
MALGCMPRPTDETTGELGTSLEPASKPGESGIRAYNQTVCSLTPRDGFGQLVFAPQDHERPADNVARKSMPSI